MAWSESGRQAAICFYYYNIQYIRESYIDCPRDTAFCDSLVSSFPPRHFPRFSRMHHSSSCSISTLPLDELDHPIPTIKDRLLLTAMPSTPEPNCPPPHQRPPPNSKPHLLTLPYDIRHLIYAQLFPSGPQLYIHVLGSGNSNSSNSLACISPAHSLPTGLLRVNRQLHAEGSGYLYNRYLFNLVGTKRDCLAGHGSFVETVRRYSRVGGEVRVDAFSNGRHSATMCVSVMAGESKVGVLRARERGELVRMEEVAAEVAAEGAGAWRWEVRLLQERTSEYLQLASLFLLLLGTVLVAGSWSLAVLPLLGAVFLAVASPHWEQWQSLAIPPLLVLVGWRLLFHSR